MLNLYDHMGVAKGLRLEPWYRGVKEKKFLPPIQACVNPAHGCNLACLCCEFALAEGESGEEIIRMPEGHLLRVVDALVEWGVKGVTFGTVGEPMLHKDLANAIILARVGGMDVSVITNGVGMTEEVADAIAGMCSTVWFKIPAAEQLTYEAVTRRRFLTRVLNHVKLLLERNRGNGLKIGWRYDMTTLNFDEAAKACQMARQEKFDMFLARPLQSGVAEMRQDAEEMTTGIGVEEVEKVWKACKKEEGENFRVRVEGKTPKGGFHQCYSAPLTIHLGADGAIYFCHDQYGHPDYSFGLHKPDPKEGMLKAWGGEAHQHHVFEDTPFWCEAACSLREYHLLARALVWEERDPLRQWQIIR